MMQYGCAFSVCALAFEPLVHPLFEKIDPVRTIEGKPLGRETATHDAV